MRLAALPILFSLLLSSRTSLSHKQGSANRENVNSALHRRTDTRCAPGTYSSTGTAPCTNCAAGTYTKEYGQRKCLQARAGYSVPSAGLSTETACSPGTYNNNPGSTGCLRCPAGYMCPSSSMSVPQQCSPGRYSTGGVTDCPRCAAGYFNNIHKATGCCACAAGWFNGNPGNTNCQMCPNQYPFSAPGTTAQNLCTATPGIWAPSKTSSQGSDGACPVSVPSPSAHPKRHLLKPKPQCRTGEKACPVYRGVHVSSYTCTDVQSNLVSCGGCVSYSVDGIPSMDGGRDCSAIPFVNEVHCDRGKCKIGMCEPGYTVSLDGGSCIAAFV